MSPAALVTEADQSLGRAVAAGLAEAGVPVVAHARAASAPVAGEIAAAGGAALATTGDLSREQEVDRVVGEAERRFGSLGVLVYLPAPLPRQPFASLSPEDWARTLRGQFHAAFLCARRVAPAMVRAGRGHIIHIVGSDPFLPARQRSQAMTCHAGLIGLTRALAKELGRHGITVNAIVPGRFEGDGSRALPAKALQSMIPSGRLGRLDELGGLCAFLASPPGAYVNGQTLHCDGGQVMW
jgi:NAD(P)-dependent dehydrogenase (short-subunit alcohol dehydrogenase family)